jgi:hypothetical protein
MIGTLPPLDFVIADPPSAQSLGGGTRDNPTQAKIVTRLVLVQILELTAESAICPVDPAMSPFV